MSTKAMTRLRQSGRTMRMIADALKNGGKCLVVATSRQHAAWIREKSGMELQTILMDDPSIRISRSGKFEVLGFDGKVYVDHHVIELMFIDAIENLHKYDQEF